MPEDYTEKRKYPRKEMSLIMEVEKTANPSHKINVITSNVSAGGVYFKTSSYEELSLGTEMDLTILVSTPIHQSGSHLSNMKGSGRIVRKESLTDVSSEGHFEQWKGIAIEFRSPLKIS